MFYSQFILAKKGPLGTIWIAAHLERKLRKNQVADTDIGVSVDSIIFPEVPIALRLSSHLLLGVVRIYSRKVNYLFHDCSEALLKIKQAFRSTAVDLPPEESTAPYHSITLPETFHLDDFELPDSALLHGNYVDHHVSTREQITLQDNMEGAGYRTSQFGLDERFGDGDTSQIRLDLDEDLFLDKATSPINDTTQLDPTELVMHAGQTSFSLADVDIEESLVENEKDKITDFSSEPVVNGCDMEISSCFDKFKGNEASEQRIYNIHTPDLNEALYQDQRVENSSAMANNMAMSSLGDGALLPDFTELAQGPSTPGIVEEAIPASVQEIPVMSPQEKTSPVNDVEAIKNEAEEIVPGKSSAGDHPVIQDGTLCGPVANDVIMLRDELVNCQTEEVPSMEQLITHEEVRDGPSTCTEISDVRTVSENSPLSVEVLDATRSASAGNRTDLELTAEISMPTAACVSELRCSSSALDKTMASGPENVILEKVASIYSPEASDRVDTIENGVSPIKVQDFKLHAVDNAYNNPGQDQEPDHIVISDNLSCMNKVDYVTPGFSSKDITLENSICSSVSEVPEVEKMLSAPTPVVDLPNVLGEITVEKDIVDSFGSIQKLNSLSGRKRSLAGTTPVLQNCSSNKLSRSKGSKGTEYIPDDDDLLASILVGKRGSTFNMKPSPPPPKTSKRPRLTPNISTNKRKVLTDDTMVLHADAIRQQLINTEDIRRVRKKAPCSHSEIWLIEKCFSEEEIFNESVFSGMSYELITLHTRTYEVNAAQRRQIDVLPYIGASKEVNVNSSSELDAVINVKETVVPIPVLPIQECGDKQPSGASVHEVTENQEHALEGNALRPRESPSGPLHLEGSSSNQIYEMTNNEPHAQVNKDFGGVEVPEPQVLHCGSGSGFLSGGLQKEASPAANFAEGDKSIEDVIIEEHPIDELFHLSHEFGNFNEETSQVTKEASLVTSAPEVETGIAIDEHGNSPLCPKHSPDANGLTFVEENISNISDGKAASLDEEQIDMVTETNNLATEVPDVLCVSYEGEPVANDMLNNQNSKTIVYEESQMISSWSLLHNKEGENVSSAIGETSGCQESRLDGTVNVECLPMDFNSARESSDFCSVIEGDDTDFLNANDDADDFDDADDDVQNPVDNRSLENSGWSSRTRGVARYLKSLFDNESVRGRKLAVDHLLHGKTRKEASRMFFETLVLKTRDYIQVEQENPFGNISIQPRSKLLKTDF